VTVAAFEGKLVRPRSTHVRTTGVVKQVNEHRDGSAGVEARQVGRIGRRFADSMG